MLRTVTSVFRTGGDIVWQTLLEFMGDRCPQMAAALSYYTVFSLPPLLVLVIMIAEPFLDPVAIEAAMQAQFGGLLGAEGAAQVQTVVENVSRPGEGGALTAAFGIGAFVFGATVAFAQLQDALNIAWQVAPDPTRGDVKNFLLKRVLSFAMILSIGFLLLVSLVVSALLAAFGDALAVLAPGWISQPLLQTTNTLVSLTIITLLFATMFRFLPDAVVAWRDALLGGLITSLLFNLGRAAIGFYLGQAEPASVYGAAGSLALILIWIYYSSMILLFGAEFTQVWARRRGSPIRPVPGAARVVRTQERREGDGG
jgi:membrane protein